jgi:hypothetical protein
MQERDALVPQDRRERLVAAARTSLGDRLRSVTYFTPDEFEQLYLRSDLEADADLTGFVVQARDGFRSRTAYAGSELGEYDYTVRAFENGHLVRVTNDDEGLFVTASTITFRRAQEVTSALQGALDDETYEED